MSKATSCKAECHASCHNEASGLTGTGQPRTLSEEPYLLMPLAFMLALLEQSVPRDAQRA